MPNLLLIELVDHHTVSVCEKAVFELPAANLQGSSVGSFVQSELPPANKSAGAMIIAANKTNKHALRSILTIYNDLSFTFPYSPKTTAPTTPK